MNLVVRLALTFIATIFLFSTGLSMYNPSVKKPYIVKVGTFEQVKTENEAELGKKYESIYMKDSDYSKDGDKHSYSSHSEQYGKSEYEIGEKYYEGVNSILDKYYEDIEKSAQSDFDYIRVHAGWHSNEQDSRHITISFAKVSGDEIKETEEKVRLHLDETGIKPKK